ncbi:MAG: heparinase, partial [Gammaproteobacteria bacterium]|nr:heparinase [Gammaproteobacteria bacterium]
MPVSTLSISCTIEMQPSVKSTLRVLHTLRHLKSAQLAFLAIRRGLPPRAVKPTASARIREEQYLQPLLPVRTFEQSEDSFSCLNQSVEFESGRINWSPSKQSRLWCYHLHYFDQLRDIYRSPENKQFLIEDWISQNPQGSQPAWEPYTVSLRIINWVAFMLSDAAPRRLPLQWLDSLYEQALWLEKNDERHILANHYFENIKAWLFAGIFFQGSDAERWLANGKRLLLKQLSEQFLDDGGHYERSPHYHALMMENLLDLLNLSKSNSGVLGSAVESALETALTNGLSFLHRITCPDGTIPLFNDAVQAASPSIDELYVYAAKFIDIEMPEYSSGIELIEEPDTGLYGYRNDEDMLLIDCGDIGPDYQPGHTHCDFLSFELILEDEPVIVDSGVYEYQPGAMRDYVRSTAAHNTLTIDGQE